MTRDPSSDDGPWLDHSTITALRPKRPSPVKPWLWGSIALGVVVAATLAEAFYTVQPTEMAGVRRLGTVVSAEPVGPGLHMKLPWVDVVDRIQTSLSTFQLDKLTVYTIDNQAVTVGLGISYRIPAAAVLKLLYTVGRTGNVDLDENIRPVLADRVLRVFSTQSTVNISANREQILAEIRRQVVDGLGTIFGLQISDLQLSSIDYSPSFRASVEAAVQAKNDAIRAENTVVKVRYEGEQAKVQADAQAAVVVAKANGDAEAEIAHARAERESAILRAQGQGQALLLTGDAEAKTIQLVGTSVTNNPNVIAYETAHRWNGQMPATVLGGTSPLAMLNLPPTH